MAHLQLVDKRPNHLLPPARAFFRLGLPPVLGLIGSRRHKRR